MFKDWRRSFLLILYIYSIQSACAREFKQALPGYLFSFPRDHAAHEDFKTEWWYFTGHLTSQSNERFGYELTFFRTATENQQYIPQSPRNIYLAHFAVTDCSKNKFFSAEKMSRKGISIADARSDICFVYEQLWSLEQLGDRFVIRADMPEYGIHLQMRSQKVPTIHGVDGVSQKASCKGCASHYYSMTRLETNGIVLKDGHAVPVRGTSWMDHEFGSNQLTKEQVGWDWFSVQLENDYELMLYLMRRSDGTLDANSSGTLVSPNGTVQHLKFGEFSVKSTDSWRSSRTGAKYPMGWKIALAFPSHNIALTIAPVMREQELFNNQSTGIAYWEGACDVSGNFNRKPVSGRAYVELTGYAQPIQNSL